MAGIVAGWTVEVIPVQEDREAPRAGEEFEQLRTRIETVLAGIIADTGELAEIVNRIRNSPGYESWMPGDMAGIEKKLHELKGVLRSMDGFNRLSTNIPLTLFPASRVTAYHDVGSFMQLPSNQRVEFSGPYATLNDLFNQGLDLGSVVEFYSSTIAGMDACTTCSFIMIDAYMRAANIETKNVRFVTAEPMRYGEFFKRLDPVIHHDARLDCIKIAAIDTAHDARALLENLGLTLDVPRYGLVIINCIDTIIALLGYDSMARRDRLKSALFQALRQAARDNEAIVIVTALIRGKPKQNERENCDYVASVDPQSSAFMRLRVLGRGQAYINKRHDGLVVTSEPVSFASCDEGVPKVEDAFTMDPERDLMARIETFNQLVITMQEESRGNPLGVEAIVERAISCSVASSAGEASSLLHELRKMRLIVDVGEGLVKASR